MKYNLEYTYNNKNIECIKNNIADKDFLNDKKLSAKLYKNAYVLPRKQIGKYPYVGLGGCLDCNKNFIPESADYDLPESYIPDIPLSKYKFGGLYEFTNYDYIDENVIYIGLCQLQWGHFLIDCIQRLWFLVNNSCNYKIVFSGIINKPEYTLKGNYLELLELFGIKKNQIIVISNPTKFKSVIVPEQSIWPGKWYTKEYVQIINQITQNTKKTFCDTVSPFKKIYLSRLNFGESQKKEIGEENIQSVFSENGYKVIYPEQLSLKEQIYYLNGADRIATICGTLSHNILFAKDGIELVYLSKSSIINTYQYNINQIKNATITWIDIYREPFKKFPLSIGTGPFWLIYNNNLKRYAYDNNFNIRLVKNDNRYIRYFMMCVRTIICHVIHQFKLVLSKTKIYEKLRMVKSKLK